MTRHALLILSLLASGCVTTRSNVAMPDFPVSIAQLERFEHEWVRAMRDHDYARAQRTYESWEDALDRAGRAVRTDPEYADNNAAFEQAGRAHNRIVEHRTLATRVDEMKALRVEINFVLQRAHRIATNLPDSDDLNRDLSDLDRAIRELTALRKRGREFERYVPFQEFASEVQKAKTWLYRRKRQAEWAREVSDALSDVITRGGLAAKSAMDTDDRRARKERLVAARKHFEHCLKIGKKASEAGGYADDYPLDTPVGKAPLDEVVAICRQAIVRASELKRSRRS